MNNKLTGSLWGCEFHCHKCHSYILDLPEATNYKTSMFFHFNGGCSKATMFDLMVNLHNKCLMMSK